MNNFKCILDNVYRSEFLASILPRTHQIVYKSLNNVDFSLSESFMFMSSHTVGDIDWSKANIASQSGIANLNFLEVPLSEQLNLFYFLLLAQSSAPLNS